MRALFSFVFIMAASVAQAEPALTQAPPLAKGIDAYPRLTATSAAALHINARLAALETDPLADLKDCDGARSVTTTYLGKDFLSLTDSSEGMCEGAAHPFHGQTPVSFDLTTGTEVDWAALLPKSLLDPEASDYDPTYPLRSVALEQTYMAARQPLADAECTEALVGSSPLDFDFWLDGDHQSLAMAPNSLPYADSACGDTVYLSVKDLSKLGAPARLIAALTF